MMLTDAIAADLRLTRALGAVLTAQETILRACGRTFGDIPLEAISAEACAPFCRGTGLPTRHWENKQHTVRGFCTALRSRGAIAAAPLQEPGPRALHSFQPSLDSHGDRQRLLEATAPLAAIRFPLPPLTSRTLILLLYGAGRRVGEAIRLRRCDGDLHDRLLSIGDTQFLKSRGVPIGVELCHALETYRTARDALCQLADSSAAFFASRNGGSIARQQLEKVCRPRRQQADVRRPATARWQPRLQDLRHTMAVHRVVAWDREDVDVEARLPLLATSLGHVNRSGTHLYLPMPPALLAAAALRFERYASVGKENAHGEDPLHRPGGASLFTGRGRG